MKMTPANTRPTAHAKIVRLAKNNARLTMPTRQIWKWNHAAASVEIIAKITTALSSPERIWAVTYSTSDSGATNMLLRLCDQMFQRLPTVTEYWFTRITSHSSKPSNR